MAANGNKSEAVSRAMDLAKQGEKDQAVENLLGLEKKHRMAEESSACQEVCMAILEVCHTGGDWKQLLDQITLLAKRRGQLKSTIQAIVRKAAQFVDSCEDKQKKKELIRVLQAVTEGKIFVEIERARLTKKLAHILESEGLISEAADAMQEIAVETYGAMHRSEKIAFILEQMRLCMDCKDFVRAQILSRKVSPKAFAGQVAQEVGEISLQGTAIEKPEEGTPQMAQLKRRYYEQMIRFYQDSNNYLEIVRCLLSIYADVKTEPAERSRILKQVVWYMVLCPSFSTQEGSQSDYQTLMHSVANDSYLPDIPEHKDLLNIFITQEVTGVQTLFDRYAAAIEEQESIFTGEAGKARLEDFRARITQHNILVVAQYYSRLSLKRMAALLNLSEDVAEMALSDLVIKGALVAKTDRPAGVVTFCAKTGSLQEMDTWSGSIAKLLDLVETTCQKIQKESMQHNVPIGAA